MRKQYSKRIILVVGAARSGTSLLMHALHGAGGLLSKNMTSVSDANPLGPLEDMEFFRLNREIYERKGTHHYLPFDCQILTNDDIEYATEKVIAIANTEYQDGETWLLKDPKATQLVPLWRKIFKSLGFEPIFLLAVRDPQAVVHSMSTNYGHTNRHAELVWLVKNTTFLAYAENDCAVVSYDAWIESPKKLIEDLVNWVNSKYQDGVLYTSSEAESVFNPDLNRSANNERKRLGHQTNELYQELLESSLGCGGINKVAIMNARKRLEYLCSWLGYVDINDQIYKHKLGRLERRLCRKIERKCSRWSEKKRERLLDEIRSEISFL